MGGGGSSVQTGVGQSLSQVWVEGRSKAGEAGPFLPDGGGETISRSSRVHPFAAPINLWPVCLGLEG